MYANSKNVPQGVKDIINLKYANAIKSTDGVIVKESTCTEEGTKTGTCKVCKKEVTEKIDAKEHSYSESWTKDASGRWHACVCGAKKDFEEHTYDIGKVVQEPTCTQEGKKTVYCTVCLYEKVETIVIDGEKVYHRIYEKKLSAEIGKDYDETTSEIYYSKDKMYYFANNVWNEENFSIKSNLTRYSLKTEYFKTLQFNKKIVIIIGSF